MKITSHTLAFFCLFTFIVVMFKLFTSFFVAQPNYVIFQRGNRQTKTVYSPRGSEQEAPRSAASQRGWRPKKATSGRLCHQTIRHECCVTVSQGTRASEPEIVCNGGGRGPP